MGRTPRKQIISTSTQPAPEEMYRAIFEQAADGIFIADTQGRFLEVNRQGCELLGYSRQEVLNLSWQDLIPTEDLANDPLRQDDLRAGKTVLKERRLRCKDGHLLPVEISARMLSDGSLLGMVRDISERKRAEHALREKDELLREVSGMAKIGGWEFDVATLQGTWTEEVARIHDLDPESETNVELGLSFYQGESREKIESALREAIDLGKPYDLELELVTAEGNHKWVRTIGHPIKHDDQVVKVRGTFQDITERKRAEEEIRRLNEELEQRVVERTAQLEAANKELGTFAYSVSHDLRAPLRAIDGYTRILQEDYAPSLDAEGQRVCGVVRDQARRMGQLIDDLLAFSRLGRAQMQAAPIDMERLVASVFDELTTSEDRERLDFQVDPLPAALGDPTLIRQVWLNLLANAVKFSSKRERAVIEVGGRQDGGENVYWVRDNGAGFEMQYADKLFGVFQRLHSEREFAGTGVGLAIVRRVIRRHGGRVWAQGEVDQGATFYFTLPRKGG
jgi:PAS domain S-box-containing protein